MISAKTYFARMNEGRTGWMTEDKLVVECAEFFKSNGYENLERDKILDEGSQIFNSLLVGSRGEGSEMETIATYFRPRLDKHDIALFGVLESMLFDILDNYESTNFMLVTDSLSYVPITKIDELGVAVENLMDEGMFLLFLNGRSGHALFDDFKKLAMPIPVQD
ncbi:MAG TPA: hypothetical protein VLA68_06815 [Nitrososphaera sp.]|nr:hypothetical protein [Nitrososphaera sp.]